MRPQVTGGGPASNPKASRSGKPYREDPAGAAAPRVGGRRAGCEAPAPRASPSAPAPPAGATEPGAPVPPPPAPRVPSGAPPARTCLPAAAPTSPLLPRRVPVSGRRESRSAVPPAGQTPCEEERGSPAAPPARPRGGDAGRRREGGTRPALPPRGAAPAPALPEAPSPGSAPCGEHRAPTGAGRAPGLPGTSRQPCGEHRALLESPFSVSVQEMHLYFDCTAEGPPVRG